MTSRLIYDKRTGGWISGTVASDGRIMPQSSAPTAPTTCEQIWLTTTIKNDDTRFVDELAKIPAVDELHIFIDSNGGHVAEMANMLDAIKSHPAKRKITHAVGKTFSAAAAVFLVGDERLMTPGACLMVHNVATGDGDDTTATCIEFSESICDLFHVRAIDIDRATIREWQHAETYISPGSALRLGLATGMDLTTQGLVGVDASDCNQPGPPGDYPATRRFMAKLAGQRSTRTREPIRVPAMPSALQGNFVAGTAHEQAMRRRMAAAQASGATDVRSLIESQRLQLIVEASGRLRDRESNACARALASR